MKNIVISINEERIKERDGNYIQFFDKKKQITNEDLQTIAVNRQGVPLQKNEKTVYDLYIEITNESDPYAVVTKKVEGNEKVVNLAGGARKRINLKDYYSTAYKRYLERQEQSDDANNDLRIEIEKLKAENEALKNQKPLSKKELKALEKKQSENELAETIENDLE